MPGSRHTTNRDLERMRKLAAEGWTKSEASRAIGVSFNTVNHWARKEGIAFRNGKAGRRSAKHT